MKEGIHPRYKPVVVTCAGCGTKVETRSTRAKDFTIDVCSHCHPFYTGRQKFVDSAGRVERFQKKWAKKPKAEAPTEAKAEVAAEAKAEAPAETKVEAPPAAQSGTIVPQAEVKAETPAQEEQK